MISRVSHASRGAGNPDDGRSPRRRILFVCDGTATSAQVFGVALSTAKRQCAALRGICVVAHAPLAADLIGECSLGQDQRECEATLLSFKAPATTAGISMDAQVVFGDVSEQVVTQVFEFGIDLLVLAERHVKAVAHALRHAIEGRSGRRVVAVMGVNGIDTSFVIL